MPKNVWLIIDASYIGYGTLRNGFLSYNNEGTGTVYGFLQTVRKLQSEHLTQRVVFCFDRGRNFRFDILPQYKARRQAQGNNDFDLKFKNDMKRQIRLLGREILPELGYLNVFSEPGFEGDDMIAAAVAALPPDDEGVIVGSDKDFYQLLSPNVCMVHPFKQTCKTAECVREEFGVGPDRWVELKAIAGCETDSIPGCRGVGEMYAAQYVSGRMKPKGKIYDRIRQFVDSPEYDRNLRLVRLPLDGCPTVSLQHPDRLTPDRWKALTDRYGLASLATRGPGGGLPAAGFNLGVNSD